MDNVPSIATGSNAPWLRPCPLSGANALGRPATQEELRRACRRPSCWACTRHQLQNAATGVAETLRLFSFPRVKFTWNMSDRPLSRFGQADIEEAVSRAESVATTFAAHRAVMAVVIKLEFAFGATGSAPVRPHVHGLLLIRNTISATKIVEQLKPRWVVDSHISSAADGRWLGYLCKPGVCLGDVPAGARSILQGVEAELARYLSRRRVRKQLLWLDGLFDGRVRRYAVTACRENREVLSRLPSAGDTVRSRMDRECVIAREIMANDLQKKWLPTDPFFTDGAHQQ